VSDLPQWLHEKMAEVVGEHARPLSDRELAGMVRHIDGPGATNVRAVAEILRLREQLKAIHHAPDDEGMKAAVPARHRPSRTRGLAVRRAR